MEKCFTPGYMSNMWRVGKMWMSCVLWLPICIGSMMSGWCLARYAEFHYEALFFFFLSFLSYYLGTECAGSENLCSDVLVHMASLKWKSLAQSNEEATISVQGTHEVQSDWQQLYAKHSAAAANRDKMQCRQNISFTVTVFII